MASTTPTSTTDLIESLSTRDRKLVLMFIKSLAAGKLDVAHHRKVTRSIKRAAREPQDKKSYKNGYTMYYTEQYPLMRAKCTDKIHVCDVAKQIGADWQALSQESKESYRRTAEASRSSKSVAD